MKRMATASFTRMAKRLVVLAAVLAVMLAAAVPVFAQEQGSATGVLLDELPADVGANGTHSITDEASATVYALKSGAVDLDDYVGQEVTVYGILTPGEAGSGAPGFEGSGTLPSIDVTRVEPADGPPPPGPSPERTATFDFQLTVKGEPPADARFFGAVPAEGCISVPLADPDADGVFTASLDVPRFPPGPVPPDAEPVSLPVQIVQANGGASPCDPTGVIRNFGTVPADDDFFRARVNFKEDRGGDTTTPEEPTDECLALSPNPEECDAHVDPGDSDDTGSDSGSSDSGSSDSSDSGSGSSGDGSDSGSSDSGDSGSSGSGSDISDNGGSSSGAESSGSPGGVTSGIRGLLPSTGGGVALWVLGAGMLLIGGGLLVRRLAR